MVLYAYEDIYRVVTAIPFGRVATYGQVAQLAGIPRHARSVGYALSALRTEGTVPWHRVLNAAGKISDRSTERGAENTQRIRLEQEGVRFDMRGRVNLVEFQWKPERRE